MAQAGLHGLVGMAVRKWMPKKEGLIPGILLGSLIPDMDNLVVAVATVSKLSTEGLHRTFTHSLFTVVIVFLAFTLASLLTNKLRWLYLGMGLAIGMVLHILLDLLLWFDGVALLWPIQWQVNFWRWFTPPDWLTKILQTGEFLFLALFFISLQAAAHRQKTDLEYMRTLRVWIFGFLGWFILFTVLAFVMKQGFMIFYGLFYLVALGLAFGIVIRMRKTVAGE